MKTFTLSAIGAGLLGLASAQQIPMCAVPVLDATLGGHPEFGCSGSTIYNCFCESPGLHVFYMQIAQELCPNAVDWQGALDFITGLCRDFGSPIVLPSGTYTGPSADSTTIDTATVTIPDVTITTDDPMPTWTVTIDPHVGSSTFDDVMPTWTTTETSDSSAFIDTTATGFTSVESGPATMTSVTTTSTDDETSFSASTSSAPGSVSSSITRVSNSTVTTGFATKTSGKPAKCTLVEVCGGDEDDDDETKKGGCDGGDGKGCHGGDDGDDKTGGKGDGDNGKGGSGSGSGNGKDEDDSSSGPSDVPVIVSMAGKEMVSSLIMAVSVGLAALYLF